MVTSDQSIVRLKHGIMEEVCKLAWRGELDAEHKEAVCYEIIPGPRPTYRCCVYKEREIVRQRVILSCADNLPIRIQRMLFRLFSRHATTVPLHLIQ